MGHREYFVYSAHFEVISYQLYPLFSGTADTLPSGNAKHVCQLIRIFYHNFKVFVNYFLRKTLSNSRGRIFLP